MADAGADAQPAVLDLDAVELADAVDVDQMLRPRQPERHGRHEALPAGQHAAVVVGVLARAGPAFPRWSWGRGTGTGRASSARKHRAVRPRASTPAPCSRAESALARPAIRTICCRRQPKASHAADHRTTASPQGRPAARHRRGPLQRRRQSAAARPMPIVLRSPHAHARIRGIDTAAARAHAGRAGGADRRRRHGRRAEGDPAHADPDEAAGRHPAGQQRRLAARLRAAGSAADRQGPLRRRSRS